MVGVITHKDYMPEFIRIANHRLYYFNQRGKDMDVDILFLVGTPFIPPIQVPFEYVLRFPITWEPIS